MARESHKPRVMVITRWVTLLFLVPAMTGCAGDGMDDDASGPDDESADQKAQVPELAPVYGLQLNATVQTQSRSEANAKIVEFKTSAQAVVTVEQDGASVRFMAQPCSAVLPEVAGFQPTVDDQILLDLPPIPVEGTIQTTGGQSKITTSPAIFALGVNLPPNCSDAEGTCFDPSDPLPRDGDDPRVADNNGDHGFTIDVSIVSIFAAAKISASLEAEFSDIARITGAANDFALENAVYGDDSIFVNAKKEADKAEADTMIPPEAGLTQEAVFELTAMPAGSTCANL